MLEVCPEEVQRTAAEAYRRLPGAVALYAFGSLVGGCADRFSDIDLELITVDLASTLECRQSMYADIDEPILEWRIHPSSSDFAATVLFRHISPYQRLDIGFRQWTPDFAAKVPPPSALLWQQPAQGEATLTAGDAPYSPAVTSAEHYVVEMFLSAIRYAKARHRRQNLTSYRFASALASSVLALARAGDLGDRARLRGKLSTQDYLEMDSGLPGDTVLGLLQHCNFSNPEHMDQSVVGLLHQSKRLLTETLSSEKTADELLGQLLVFVTRELDQRLVKDRS